MYRSPFLPSLLTAAVLLAGCGGEATTETSPAAGDRPAASTEQAEPALPAPAEPSVEPSAEQGPEDTDEQGTNEQATDEPDTDEQDTDEQGADEQPTNQQGPDGEGSSGDGTSGGTEGLPGWPIESTPVHGAQFWAAYLAVGAPGDPALQRVLQDVQQLWPGAGLGELGCDEGAAAALGRASTEHAVAVYFATEQHISEFLRRWGDPFVGAVHVTTHCAD
jgi:hypothetical protein